MTQLDLARQQLNWWCLTRPPLRQGYTERQRQDSKGWLAGFLRCYERRNPLPPA